jgi:aspartate carbamoyltransferase catalytic subunit
LGGDIMSITDPNSTGIAKGESYSDVAEMLNNYGDLVILRDNNENAVYEMLNSLRIPIVNAGNGTDEHPTQALADIYTMFKWRPHLMDNNSVARKPVKIGIIGVPGKMRTVRSLLYLMSHFPNSFEEIFIITAEDKVFAENQKENYVEMGLNITVTSNFQEILPSLDVIYINSIAWVGDSYEEIGQEFALDANSNLKPGSIILHPLARGKELDTSLDKTPHNWYFSQARSAVFIRMALLTCLVQHNW